MNLWAVILECLAIYVFLNFLLIPRLKSAWLANRSIEKVAKIGVLAATGSFRDVAFIATLVLGAFGLLAAILWLVPDGNLLILQWSVGFGSTTLELLQRSKKVFDRWFFLLPTVLIAVIWWRRQHRTIRDRLRGIADGQFEQLNEERLHSPDAWGALESTPKMHRCEEQIQGLASQLNALDITTSAGRKGRQKLLRQIVSLREEREKLDYERRIQWSAFGGDPKPLAQMSRWQRLGDIFLSQGLFSDAKGMSKVLRRASTAMLCLALIGAAPRAGVTTTMSNRLTRLDAFRVKAVKERTQREWKQQASRSTTELTPADSEAIKYFTDQFARALARNAAWRPFEPAQDINRSLRQMLVERAVLSEIRVPDEYGQPVPYDVENPHHPLAEELSEEVGRQESRLGESLARQRGQEIKSWFGERWGATRDALLKHAALYREPVRVHDLESALVDHFLSEGLDPVLSYEGSNEFVKAARGATSSGAKKAAGEAVDIGLRRMVMSMVHGESFESALHQVSDERAAFPGGLAEDMNRGFTAAGAPPTDATDLGDLESGLAASRPHGPKPPPPTTEAMHVAEEIASDATDNHTYSLSDYALEFMAEYEDHFPISAEGASSTNLAREVRSWQLPHDTGFFRDLQVAKIARARSFSMLRGFSRVGGVLIGREPDNKASSANFEDIQWAIVPEGIRLWLLRRGGARQLIGDYPRSTLHQALAYAADGRPVAATMTTARPLPQLKIQVHPALVDTRLGCEITELDRFVDTFTDGTLPERKRLHALYRIQADCYNFTRAARIRTAATYASPSDKSWLQSRSEDASSPSVQASVDSVLVHPWLLSGRSTLFARKPEFFSEELVSVMARCARKAHDHDELAQRVSVEFQPENWGTEERARELLVPAAQFQVWSGVRERPFQLDSEGAFLRAPADSSVRGRLWPFDFVIQVAFISAAVRVRNPNSYSDEHPLEFVELEQKIEDQVWQGIVDNGLESCLRELRDFVVLQRLFRVAISGRLGPGFPAEKLRALARATAEDTQYFYTRRWNGSVTSYLSRSGEKGLDAVRVVELERQERAFGVLEDERRASKQGSCLPRFWNHRGELPTRSPR